MTVADVPRRKRRRRIVVAVSVLALAAAGGAWLSRVPIATRVIDRELAARGVTARYGIADLGFGRQRLTNVVIGDPANPDLVADWVETLTDVGPSGPRVTGFRAGHVRIRARLVDGRVTLGAIDRLLPAGGGGPFALPAIDVAVGDARIRLETPYGTVGARLAGAGRLDDGFRGQLAAVAPVLDFGGCRLRGTTAAVAIGVRRAAPTIAGPVQAASIDCAGVRVVDARTDVAATLSGALDRWTGKARVAAAAVEGDGARLTAVGGTIGFAGDRARTGGAIALTAATFRTAPASGGASAVTGTWRWADGRATLAAGLRARDVAVAPDYRARLAALGDAARGTPVAPLAAALGGDLARAARDFDLDADAAFATGTPALLTVATARAVARSGAVFTLDDGAGVVVGHPAGVRIDGRLTMRGGGLPDATVALAQPAPGAAVSGVARVARYARGDAALELTPVRFVAGAAGTAISTRVTLSGPLADGRVDRLTLPVAARWDGRGSLVIDRDCIPVTFDRLAISSLTLRPARLRLCATDGALVRVAGGRVTGGARIDALRLTGAIGATPLDLAASGATVRLADRGVALTGVEARIGAAGRVTRMDIARLDGAITAQGAAGTFAGGAGQIANVPLVMDAAAGHWALADGTLSVGGALNVADSAATPRFRPLDARDVALTLAGGDIAATARLVEPGTGTKVADVALRHALGPGTGHATLAVPGITFGDGFQPDLLTPLTFGVIADVRGTVSGSGRIDWGAAGVTSTGAFTTAGTDLAAAFGPVQGLAGTIRFTDLLALESAPAQVATVKSINPGVPVNDGRIVYRTLANTRVQVDSGVWPFAGGTLTLEPTLLDFSAPVSRTLTFRVDGMDAGKFLQQFDFSNLNATGTFDGVLPMIFDADGGRIEGGRLVARPGGGGIAYLGELTEKDLGFWGNFAFQALRSLTYRNLEVAMDGPLAGEMVTAVRFAGIRQGAGAKSNFLIRRLTRLPIVFSIAIRAPFRGLIDSAASFYDPKRLVARNLQQLLEEQNRQARPDGTPADPPVQPPASETVP